MSANITYMRVSLLHLVTNYVDTYYKKGAILIGHSYDARKDDIIIELMLPEELGKKVKK